MCFNYREIGSKSAPTLVWNPEVPVVHLQQIKNTNKMELLRHIVDPVILHTYTVQHPTEGVLIYKEWIDSETGKCVDYTLESKSGYGIHDSELIEEIMEFIDNQNK